MVMCFVPDCKHYSERDGCRFFVFPKNPTEKKRWISLLRRSDREPSIYSLVCSCHFLDKDRKNGPTLFEHNNSKRFLDEPSTSTQQSKKTRKEIQEKDILMIPTTSQLSLRPSTSYTSPPLNSEQISEKTRKEIQQKDVLIIPTTSQLSLRPSTSYTGPPLNSEQISEKTRKEIQQNDVLMIATTSQLSLRPSTSYTSPPLSSEHDYCRPSTSKETAPLNCIASIEAENYFLKKELKEALQKVNKLSSSFSFAHIENSDEQISVYTGLPSKDIFMSLFKLMNSFSLNYYQGWTVMKVEKIDQLLLSLMKLKLNLVNEDLAVRFNISCKTVANIFYTWLYALHEILFKNLMSKIPSRNKNKLCMPTCFSNFTNCRIILDCTEIYCNQPKQMDKQKLMYSSYKHRNTLKGLIGVAPNGVVTYASKLYPGSVSDKKIVKHCGILEQLLPGDLVIADKGFLISDLLPSGVNLNIPPFLTTGQFTPQQVVQTRTIAKARIHVERGIRRIKCYKILNLVPSSLVPHASVVFQVCAALTNFNFPLIREVGDLYKTAED